MPIPVDFEDVSVPTRAETTSRSGRGQSPNGEMFDCIPMTGKINDHSKGRKNNKPRTT